jgi:hypothetical protein
LIKLFKYVALCCALLTLITCKKKSSITVKAYNYAMGEPIANAEVIIVESKIEGGLFSATSDCKEVAHATTDANGQCVFTDLKLKKKQSVQYAAKIKYSYGKSDLYNCNVTENSEIKLGSNNLVLNSSTYDCFFKVQYNNLLNPSQVGDSMIVSISSPKYEVLGQPYPFGGGGAFGNKNLYGDNNYPYPTVFSSNLIKSNGGKHILRINKVKMGVVTQTIDTVKIYPYETKIVEVNW